jgi:glycosyltransferase involved in cell wall biosynthesis
VRAEARAVARAGTVTAYSDRVAAAVGHGAVVVPIAYPIPPDPLPPAAGAVAACVADWAWPANRFALGVLLRCWPLVRERVPSASLLIAGPGLAPGSLGPGMTSFGPVGSSAEILARACVVVFPCPATSGPKVKVLEALACGRAVVTTAAGIEGLSIGEGSGVATAPPDPASTAAAVIPLLADPGQASVLAREGRRSIAMVHGPRPAARRRVEAWSRPA